MKHASFSQNSKHKSLYHSHKMQNPPAKCYLAFETVFKNKADFSQFFYCHKRHTATQTCILWKRHRTHTHTNTRAGRPEVAVNLFSAFSHPGPSFLKDPPGAVGRFAAPGDQVK